MTNYLVFDIETIPEDFNLLSESQQEYLLRRANDDEEILKRKNEMALSPLTARVVCIGMMPIEIKDNSAESIEDRFEAKSIAYMLDDSLEDEQFVKTTLSDGNTAFRLNEKSLLDAFWKQLAKNPSAKLISFNGRNFDAPFLMLRSAKLGIRPSRNLMSGTKFNYPLHTDLIDELTFYMPTLSGATRRYNFDFFARAFGITSPKSEGIDGSLVSEFFHNGKIDEIAEYCLRDVKATWELYLYWEKYLKF